MALLLILSKKSVDNREEIMKPLLYDLGIPFQET